jgi:hypothetical protein
MATPKITTHLGDRHADQLTRQCTGDKHNRSIGRARDAGAAGRKRVDAQFERRPIRLGRVRVGRSIA